MSNLGGKTVNMSVLVSVKSNQFRSKYEVFIVETMDFLFFYHLCQKCFVLTNVYPAY